MEEKPQILIVEDHDATRDALRRLFELRGWEVYSAGTVAEALAQIDRPTGCVILDLILPDGDGETVLGALRACRPDAAVVVVSGITYHDRLKVLEERFQPSAILPKPVPDVGALYRICERAALGAAGNTLT